jgi:hypothetical protein
MEPVYPAVIVILETLTGMSIVQLPNPRLLNVTRSATPGTLKPPAPPETFDQLAILLQLEGAAALQKRFAADELKDKLRQAIISSEQSPIFIEFGIRPSHLEWDKGKHIKLIF